jgi:hypothetical protein
MLLGVTKDVAAVSERIQCAGRGVVSGYHNMRVSDVVKLAGRYRDGLAEWCVRAGGGRQV